MRGRTKSRLDRTMETREYNYEVEGEVIKMIHDELPAVRWTCGGCGEDSCTIFYEPEAQEKVVECESCNTSNLVRRGELLIPNAGTSSRCE